MEDTLISFTVAKLAKEKGFNILTLNYYFEDGNLKENELTGTNGYYGEEYCFSFNEFLENWNNEWLTKKDGDRCFGCNKSNGYLETFSAPTQSLLQRWLREVHDIDISIEKLIGGGSGINKVYHTKIYKCICTKNDFELSIPYVYDTYEETLEQGLQKALKLI